MPDPRTVIEDAADLEKDEKKKLVQARKEAEAEKNRQLQKAQRDAETEKKKMQLMEAKADATPSESEDAPEEDRRGGSDLESSEGDDGEEEEFSDGSEGASSGDLHDLPSQNEMKRDLIQAINEEMRERDMLRRENDDLQRNIINMPSEQQFDGGDRHSDLQMNEHKYLNTLANVHQVRINLKETQDRYNKMASELQAKLNEK